VIARREFIVALAAAGLAPVALGGRAEAQVAALGSALVLSGGGARGAYQAGVVGALAATSRIADGSPLPPYEVVCGTSIGALNGWFVASGQYTMLRRLWYGIAGQDLLQLKERYAALRDPESGVLDRAAAAFRLLGLRKDQSALLESEPVYDWIVRNLDPRVPLVMPLIWAVTNLTHQRPEYFFVDPHERATEFSARFLKALQISLGPQTVVREATPDLLHRAIFASAAIPIAFDPVPMPGPDGEMNLYCDGGVASNSPVGIAHSIAHAADVVLLDPPFEPDENLDDAVEVAFSAYGTMQRKLLEVEMRTAYFQSMGSRAFRHLPRRDLVQLTHSNQQAVSYVESVPDTDLRYMRPVKELPVSVAGFNDATGIDQTLQLGWLDAARGFTPYDWRTFVL
jgi:predicted acylesterase/phospholipase RssA